MFVRNLWLPDTGLLTIEKKRINWISYWVRFRIIFNILKIFSSNKALFSFLSGVFLLFTVGVPIVVSSCPMEKAPGKIVCSECHPPAESGQTAIQLSRNSSCCDFVIASGRNLNEYLAPGVERCNPLTSAANLPFNAPDDQISAPQTSPLYCDIPGAPQIVTRLFLTHSSLLI